VGIGDWVALAVMILSLGYLWEAGVMLMWSTLRSRANLGHVVVGTACLFVGSALLLLGVANPPDAWTLAMVLGLLVRVAFLLLGVAALQGGVALLYRPELPRRPDHVADQTRRSAAHGGQRRARLA
jgi:hypothetical protein